MSSDFHESAYIDEGAMVGEGTRVWHFSHICSGASIGRNCTIGQNVFVGATAVIGHQVKIQNNVSVYDGVTLEDGVFCGPGVVFTNVNNPRALIERKNEYRKTHISEGATLGANCTIRCGVTVGHYAFVGAGTVVLENVSNYALVVGNPGKQIGWMSRSGARLDLPLEGKGEESCSQTGEVYRLEGSTLEIVDTGQ